GSIELNISKRGVLKGKVEPKPGKCRFGNIFPDKKKVICPFDISLKKYADELCFNERNCNKNSSCLLMKIVLKPIERSEVLRAERSGASNDSEKDRIGAQATNPKLPENETDGFWENVEKTSEEVRK
ncbi:MAG: hypothetical protein WC599_13210, partial [Bacteroidales bacterium]